LGGLDFLFTLQQEQLLTEKQIDSYKNLEKMFLNSFENRRVLVKDNSLFTGVGGISYYLTRKTNNRKSILSFCY
jgi:hypothetical protein